MNFILFNIEELRAESVGCYGQPLVRTPHMDGLAAAGTRFDNCFVQHTVCSPSRCSMVTGWYPHVRGHRTLWHLLGPDEPNLLSYLRDAGYTIRWAGKNDLFSREQFQAFPADMVLPESYAGKVYGPNPFAEDDPRYYSFLYEPYAGPLEENGDFRRLDGVIRFLRSRPAQPFFAYLAITYTHPPYSAPQPWHDRIDPAALPPLRPPDLPNRPDFHRRIRTSRRLDELGDDLFRKIQAVYLGMTELADLLVGRLLDALDETGLADSTTIFICSDHGDYAGDYGLVEKWSSGLEDVLTRVPLIVRTPGGRAGHVVPEPVELFDVMATTLELAGIPARHTHFARSLTPQLGGAGGDPDRAAFAEGGYARHEPHCFEGRTAGDQGGRPATHIYYPKGKVQQDHPDSIGRAVMVRTQTAKLVHRPIGQCELYDLRSDPRELNNVHGQPAFEALQRDLERRLLDWFVQTADVVPLEEDPRGLPAKVSVGP